MCEINRLIKTDSTSEMGLSESKSRFHK